MEKTNYELNLKKLEKLKKDYEFPISSDLDIINLSDPPYYTACPNPWISDFCNENMRKYNPNTDHYQQKPFSIDVSEGKNDSIYNAHSYPTKVPPKAIVQYILHYTKVGDIIYDGFCGSGMSGVGAQMCINPETQFRKETERKMPNIEWGVRKTILADISPLAGFIAHNMNKSVNIEELKKEVDKILESVGKTFGWMYETHHVIKGEEQYKLDLEGKKIPIIGEINYTVWSDVFLCSECQKELVFWDISVKGETVSKEISCNYCNAQLKKSQLEREWITIKDDRLNQIIKQPKQIPVLISYTTKNEGKQTRYEKIPDKFDLSVLKKIEDEKNESWFPINDLPIGHNTKQPKLSHNFSHVHFFYTKRNLFILSKIFELINKCDKDSIKSHLVSTFTGILLISSQMYKWTGKKPRGILTGTLYVSSLRYEFELKSMFKRKSNAIMKIEHKTDEQNTIITTQPSTKIPQIPDNSVDYIFTDPPFGENLMYSELNFIQESWLKVFTNNKKEAIMNKSQKKGLVEYQELMEQCFKENYRILKPRRWMTIVFHNSQNRVWMAIQEALQRAGFVVADVRILDKKHETFKQINTTTAVKQDLVISAYKSSGGLDEYFGELSTGTDEGAWKFITEHLKQLPVFVEKNDLVEIITERQKFLLFDRMVAFHIQKGLTVPISAPEFYEKLHQKYPERDGMYFLSEQIPEYDQKRTQVKSIEQTTIFVEDEKSTIMWLNEQLKTPQTYQDIQPKFLQELHQNKFEKLPELSEILEQNFLQNDDNKWHIPDPSKLNDLEKLREKSLLREFKTYVDSKGKLKQFRLEAIRAGFKKKWSENNYKSIVDIARKLPEKIIREDSSLLMYYDNASSRM
jgi:DNA modification methylase